MGTRRMAIPGAFLSAARSALAFTTTTTIGANEPFRPGRATAARPEPGGFFFRTALGPCAEKLEQWVRLRAVLFHELADIVWLPDRRADGILISDLPVIKFK